VFFPVAMPDAELGRCVTAAWRSVLSMAGSFGICHAQFEAVGDMEQLPVSTRGNHPHDGAVDGAVLYTARVLEAASPAEVDGVADLDVVPVCGTAGGPVILQCHEDS
jgi:hypothetical protein